MILSNTRNNNKIANVNDEQYNEQKDEHHSIPTEKYEN